MAIKSTVTITGVGATAWVPLNINAANFNVGVLISKSPGTLDVSVEITHENVMRVNPTPTQIVSVGTAAGTASLALNNTVVATAMRFNCTAFTAGSAVASILQSSYGD